MSPIPPYVAPGGGGGAATLYGAGVPDNGDGADGDSYIDTDADAIYVKVAGAWVLKLDQPGNAIFEHFQSSSFAAGTSVLAAPNLLDEVTHQFPANINLTPNGGANWSNGVVNPSADFSALMSVRVKQPGLLLLPPADGTLVYVRRVMTLTFDGETDVDVYTDEVTYNAAHGGLYVPPMRAEVYRAVGAGFSGSAVITDELNVEWATPGDLTIYPQNDRGHGIVSGRVAIP